MHNSFDFTPLFRSTVGFDRLSRMLEQGALTDDSVSYPPYNIIKQSDDAYRITMAVAGFGEDDIEIVSKENQLTVSGRGAAATSTDAAPVTYLHRGIAERAFERRFQLADHIKVVGASLANGLLSIDLTREVPEAMKPRKIDITAGSSAPARTPVIDGKKSSCSSC